MKKFLLTFCLVLALSSAASAEIADVFAEANASGDYTLSVTIDNNPNRFLLVTTEGRAPQINNVTGCTFNTTETMTKVTSLDGVSTSNLNVSVWYRLAPSVTTANVVCTVSNAQVNNMGAYSMYNVHQTTPFRDQSGANFLETAVNNDVTTASVTLTTVAGDMTLAMLMAGNAVSNVTNLVPGESASETSGTGGWDLAFNGQPLVRGGGSSLLATTTSQARSYTWTNNEYAVLIAVAIRPASSAAVFKHYYDLLRQE